MNPALCRHCIQAPIDIVCDQHQYCHQCATRFWKLNNCPGCIVLLLQHSIITDQELLHHVKMTICPVCCNETARSGRRKVECKHCHVHFCNDCHSAFHQGACGGIQPSIQKNADGHQQTIGDDRSQKIDEVKKRVFCDLTTDEKSVKNISSDDKRLKKAEIAQLVIQNGNKGTVQRFLLKKQNLSGLWRTVLKGIFAEQGSSQADIHILIARKKRRIVGVLLYTTPLDVFEEDQYWYNFPEQKLTYADFGMELLVIACETPGCGHGTALMEEMFKRGMAQQNVFLHMAEDDNLASRRRFFTKFGFKPSPNATFPLGMVRTKDE